MSNTQYIVPYNTKIRENSKAKQSSFHIQNKLNIHQAFQKSPNSRTNLPHSNTNNTTYITNSNTKNPTYTTN